MAVFNGLSVLDQDAAYHATKFGLVGLTESLRADYGRQGIGVTTVCPGFVTSNLFEAGTRSNQNGEIRHPPAWACTTPENVARKTIRAIYRNRRLVLATTSDCILKSVRVQNGRFLLRTNCRRENSSLIRRWIVQRPTPASPVLPLRRQNN